MRKLAKKGDMNARMSIVLNKFRARLTSYPPGMCPLVLYRSLLQMSMNQSCGKCVPCRDGLVEVERLLNSILKGEGTHETLEKIISATYNVNENGNATTFTLAFETKDGFTVSGMTIKLDYCPVEEGLMITE